MGLVVNFETMQQPTILVAFFQIREYKQDYMHRANLIFYIPVFYIYLPVFLLLLLLLIASWLSNLIIKYYRQSSNLPFLNSLSLALYER